MTTILHLSSSSNLNGSYSRQMGGELVKALSEKDPGTTLIPRNLVKNPLPHLSPELFEAVMVAKDSNAPAAKLSNELTQELLASDIIVIEAPMYNFGIPSALKAWIDHVVRAGLTFTYSGANGPEGLIKHKKAILVISRGGIYSAGPAAAMEHQENYLKAILGFLGIAPIETICIEGTAMGETQITEAITIARQRIAEIVHDIHR